MTHQRKPVYALSAQDEEHRALALPWPDLEVGVAVTETVRRQLEFIGEDPTREGLVDTPARVIKALREMTSGYHEDPKEILGRVFEVEGSEEMIAVRDIEFSSLCEHHMLPFMGRATVAYVPRGNKVVGLSKIPRLVHCFARRLQMQERLTQQIADAIDAHLEPFGVGVAVHAFHTCCALRGIRSRNEMVTKSLRGRFRDDAQLRAEFIALSGLE